MIALLFAFGLSGPTPAFIIDDTEQVWYLPPVSPSLGSGASMGSSMSINYY